MHPEVEREDPQSQQLGQGQAEGPPSASGRNQSPRPLGFWWPASTARRE